MFKCLDRLETRFSAYRTSLLNPISHGGIFRTESKFLVSGRTLHTPKYVMLTFSIYLSTQMV